MRRRIRLLPQLRLQHLDRLLDLRVASLEEVGRRVVDVDVGRHAVVLHVLAGDRPHAAAGRADRRAVEQRVRPGADHRAHRRHADHLAEAERLEAGGEHLGVGGRPLVLHHDHRPVEVLRPRHLEAGVAAERVLVLPAGEDGEQLLVDAAAAVEALIDDERLLRPVGREIELELAQRRRVHRADVQVADLAVTQLRHDVAAIVHPLRVLQVAERAARDRVDRDVPRAFLRRLVVDQEVELGPGREREVAPVVVAGLQIVAVDGDDVVAFLDLEVVAIGRPVLVDVADLVEPGRVGHEREARMRVCCAVRSRLAAAAHAGVRRVQLPDHHHHDGLQLFAVDEVVEQRLVGLLRARSSPRRASWRRRTGSS